MTFKQNRLISLYMPHCNVDSLSVFIGIRCCKYSVTAAVLQLNWKLWVPRQLYNERTPSVRFDLDVTRTSLRVSHGTTHRVAHGAINRPFKRISQLRFELDSSTIRHAATCYEDDSSTQHVTACRIELESCSNRICDVCFTDKLYGNALSERNVMISY